MLVVRAFRMFNSQSVNWPVLHLLPFDQKNIKESSILLSLLAKV
jgi:hypothetical protein